MEIISVLFPTSFNIIKLALSVWRKHKHIRTVFTSVLNSITFGPYTHSPQGHLHVHIHVCVCTHMHTLSSILTTLSTLKYTYIHSHTHLHIITNPSYTLTHTSIHTHTLHSFFPLRKYIYFYF